jgi:hypothetical protein
MFKLTQSKIKLEFMCMCIRGNSFAPFTTILPLYSGLFAQCSGYPTYWNTSYGKGEHLSDHKSFIEYSVYQGTCLHGVF